MRNKHETVLFAVSGMSPAVLTETVWALAQEHKPVCPSRVVVLTTTAGRAALVRELLTPVAGATSIWEDLRSALARRRRLAGLAFDESDIVLFKRRDPKTGKAYELDDIATPADNEIAADTILEELRRYTENPDVRLVASLAGGRKTMGALLFGCMSLLGRETDRLTHVLVGEPYDRPLLPRFYFPAQRIQRLRLPDGGFVRAVDAQIGLADLPFVPLRNRFTDLGSLPGTYGRLVTRFSRALASPTISSARIRLAPNDYTVWVDRTPLRLRPRAYWTLVFLIGLQRESDGARLTHAEAADRLRLALRQGDTEARTWSASSELADDLKRELSHIRSCCDRAGVAWKPGRRRDSLRLPPFDWEPGAEAQSKMLHNYNKYDKVRA